MLKPEFIMVLKKIYKHYLSYKCTLKSLYYKKDFEDIRIMVLTIGFNRSGSSLIGHLLTAHPNIVFADELQWPGIGIFNYRSQYLYDLYNNDNLNKTFSLILYTDRVRYLIKNSPGFLYSSIQKEVYKYYQFGEDAHRSERYVLVPNQYQGRFKKLKVIGVKASIENRVALSNNSAIESIKSKFKKRDIKLKFIFTTRNPYHLSASIEKAGEWRDETHLLKVVSGFSNNSEKILKRLDPKDVFISRYEDMCKNPGQQLTRLCNFLEVPIPANYIEDCSSQVARKPSETRLQANFSQEYKQEIASLIEKYDFFSGYSYED